MYKYSFIIPVYNSEKYLRKCVQSIKDIKLKDYEIILVDDGSQDDSGRICDQLQYECKRIRCIHQQNQGVSVARNNGLRTATGEFVIFLDADDTLEAQKLYLLLDKIEKLGNIDIAIWGMSFDYYYGGLLYRRDEMSVPFRGVEESRIWVQNMQELYSVNALSPIWNKIFRRSFLVINDLYLQESMFLYEDLEYSIRCMSRCDKILFEPEIIYHYRQAEEEGNAGRHLMRIEHLFTLVDQIEKALDQLIEKKDAQPEQQKIKSILVILYHVLAREKIAVSNRKEIRQICNDYIKWLERYTGDIPNSEQNYSELLKKCRIRKILFQRTYTKIRHKIAVRIKSTQCYQRLKG